MNRAEAGRKEIAEVVEGPISQWAGSSWGMHGHGESPGQEDQGVDAQIEGLVDRDDVDSWSRSQP